MFSRQMLLKGLKPTMRSAAARRTLASVAGGEGGVMQKIRTPIANDRATFTIRVCSLSGSMQIGADCFRTARSSTANLSVRGTTFPARLSSRLRSSDTQSQ